MSDTPSLPAPTAERRRVAAGKFERANQVAATNDHDYAIKLLMECCQLDPANLIYRRALRLTQRAKHGNNQRGSTLALLTTGPQKLRLQAARRSGDHLKALEHAEYILSKNPWDVGAQLAQAETFDALKLPGQAIWCLEMARQTTPDNKKVNRLLARLYEQRGNYAQAIVLWEWLRKQDPTDVEAAGKAKEIAALSTIARGNYEQVIAGKQAATAAEPESEAAPADAVNDTHTHRVAGTTSETQVMVHPRIAREATPLLARLKANPSNPNGYLQLAQLYRKAELPDEARKTLQQGLAPTGNAFELAAELAELDLMPFRKNLALAEEKLKRDPKNEDVRKIRAKLVKEINTRELQLFQQKAERYPTELGHRYELGVRLLRANQIDEAIRELQAARSDPRQHHKALYYLGFCFKSRNNWRLAQRNFEEALRDLPPAEEAMRKELLFQLAQGAAEAGELPHAIDVGLELANLDFGYKDIGRLLDEWQSKEHAKKG